MNEFCGSSFRTLPQVYRRTEQGELGGQLPSPETFDSTKVRQIILEIRQKIFAEIND